MNYSERLFFTEKRKQGRLSKKDSWILSGAFFVIEVFRWRMKTRVSQTLGLLVMLRFFSVGQKDMCAKIFFFEGLPVEREWKKRRRRNEHTVVKLASAMGAETDLPWLSSSTEDVFKRESDSWRSCSSPLEKKKKMKGMRAGVKVIDRSFYSNRRLQGHDFRGQWLSRWRRRRVDFLFSSKTLCVHWLTFLTTEAVTAGLQVKERERERSKVEGKEFS